jgi:hypothetical protein
MPEKSILFFMLNFRIGNGSLTYRTPVDNTGTFINPALLI